MNFWLLLLIPLCAWLNRVRGGGWGGQYLPFAQDFWVAPPMGGIAYLMALHPHLFEPWPWLMVPEIRLESAVLFALCWLCWSTPGWGCLYRMGFLPEPDRTPLWYERLFIWISGGDLVIAFGMRMVICLIPMAIIFSPAWLIIGIAFTAAYYAGWTIAAWRTYDNPNVPLDGIPWAEPLTGACWGAAIVLFGVIG